MHLITLIQGGINIYLFSGVFVQGNHKVPCGFGKKTHPCTWEMVGFDSADVHGTGSWGYLCLCAGTSWVPQVLRAGLHGRAEACGAAWSSRSPAVGTSPRRGWAPHVLAEERQRSASVTQELLLGTHLPAPGHVRIHGCSRPDSQVSRLSISFTPCL